MPPRFGNCAYSFRNSRDKPIFVPSDDGRTIGYELKAKLEAIFSPEVFCYHLIPGGHVAAIHAHRSKRYFARLDFQNFFYSLGRNRIARALHAIGLARGEYYAKWSTVKNPYDAPTYALPYGFVQSPLLASILLSRSPVGEYLREISGTIVVSVYVDDIALSGNNRRILQQAYRKLRRKVAQSNFTINENKSCAPGHTVDLFNCHLAHLRTVVTDARQAEFRAEPRTEQSQAAFDAYCSAIAFGNAE